MSSSIRFRSLIRCGMQNGSINSWDKLRGANENGNENRGREVGLQAYMPHSVHLGGLFGRELSLAYSTTGANRDLWRVIVPRGLFKTPHLNKVNKYMFEEKEEGKIHYVCLFHSLTLKLFIGCCCCNQREKECSNP